MVNWKVFKVIFTLIGFTSCISAISIYSPLLQNAHNILEILQSTTSDSNERIAILSTLFDLSGFRQVASSLQSSLSLADVNFNLPAISESISQFQQTVLEKSTILSNNLNINLSEKIAESQVALAALASSSKTLLSSLNDKSISPFLKTLGTDFEMYSVKLQETIAAKNIIANEAVDRY